MFGNWVILKICYLLKSKSNDYSRSKEKIKIYWGGINCEREEGI